MVLEQAEVAKEIKYPDRDGQRMANDTLQFGWMVKLFGNLQVLLREANAFVAADLMWYAKQGFPEECEAPDVFVAFGRPKGERPSYKQWEEDGISPQVVFEIYSPGNTIQEMERKDAFYTEYGVQEYYIYNPHHHTLEVFLRNNTVLRRQVVEGSFVSPLLGIRLDMTGKELTVYYPDGSKFLTFDELAMERAKEQRLRLAAEKDLASTQQNLTATQDKLEATEKKLEKLETQAARVRVLSLKLLLQQATPEEIAELQRLISQESSV